VGGETQDVAHSFLRLNARVVICGAISQYNKTTVPKGPENYLSLLVNRAKMEGFIVFDFAAEYSRGIRDMSRWIDEGRLKAREHIVEGLETFPETLLMLFDGRNQGKLIIKV
jgi:NADPH-dependent curcumin reductase CurA